MHYVVAIDQIQKAHLHTWGRFFKNLPNLTLLNRPEAQIILFERTIEMKKIIDDGQVGFFETCRFHQEFDVIFLLLLISIFGATNGEVPISEEDINIVDSAINNLCVAGVAEQGREVIDIVKKLFTAGMKSNQPSPETIAKLSTIFSQETNYYCS